MFKQISTVVHDDDTGYRLPTHLTQGMESSKTQCGMDPVWVRGVAIGPVLRDYRTVREKPTGIAPPPSGGHPPKPPLGVPRCVCACACCAARRAVRARMRLCLQVQSQGPETRRCLCMRSSAAGAQHGGRSLCVLCVCHCWCMLMHAVAVSASVSAQPRHSLHRR